MHKIDTPGSVDGRFTNGNPLATPPEPATQFDADWCNAVQTEITTLIVASGATLTKGTNSQLAIAVQTLIEKYVNQTTGATIVFQAPQDYAANTYYRIGDAIGGFVKTATLTGENVTMFLCGYFLIDKAVGEAYSFGDRLYWDASNDELTSDDSGGKPLAGVCVANTAAPDAKVFTRLWSLH